MTNPLRNKIEAICAVEFDGRQYILSASWAICARVIIAFHHSRRLARACKRCLLYSLYWIPPFLLFATFCSLALFIFAFTNILSTSEVPSICVSVFLGAMPLLFIKDLYDKELERHKTLLLQRETYESSISSITFLLKDCLAFCSIQLREGDREPFRCEENFNDYMESIEGCSPHFPPDCNITRLTTELTKKYASLETSMSQTRFIDVNNCSLGYNFFLSHEDIRGLEQAANERDEELLKKSAKGIVCSSFHIFASLRRPWRYPKDIDTNKKTTQWLLSHCIRSDNT